MIDSPQILVIDDDVTVMESVVDILGSTGHLVIGTYDGQAGLKLLEENLDSIEVALIDYRMPNWDGLETIAELRKVKPDLYCVLATGETRAPQSDEEASTPNAYLFKPFNLKNLTGAVSRGLDRLK